MHILYEARNNQKIENSRRRQKTIIFTRWIIGPVCMLILLGIGILPNCLRAQSANAVTAVEVKHNQPLENKQVEGLANTPSIWPVSGALTSGFGWRNSPWEDGSEFHPGIDIAVNMGTPVVATADGKVIKSGWSGGYGNIVEIDHGNGIETIYGHNSQIAVSVGQNVKKGQIISYSGSTGNSTGPHVHYEVRINGTAVDPFKFLILY
ncbi:peptidase m23 [Lucifera butyrica]|uniref:Peptidase m23 n=1 Tax=Lucifera butyrica TaxID=1351585 RepID=A0A498R355_9FIRM|nr:peptidase m23 [Lucifera butyrica]